MKRGLEILSAHTQSIQSEVVQVHAPKCRLLYSSKQMMEFSVGAAVPVSHFSGSGCHLVAL